MLLRAGVALAMLGAVFGGVAHAEASARASCEASLTAARDWAARLDSALEKLRVRVDGKRTLVAGAECNRLELEVRPDARGHADKPWRAEKAARKVSLLLDGGANLVRRAAHRRARAWRLRGVARHARRAGRDHRALQARRRRLRQRGRKTEIRTSP